jgi:putative DNA methylase
LKRKLIEVSLPLEAINKQAAREKSIRHGHPSTLHLWWARRPLAAARAVLFAQLVDDPSARPEEFPTEADQRRERDRLHGLIERLVDWDNIRDEKVFAEAHAQILKSTDGNPPPILDPFAGGGTIPLEAQRLGLEAQASDLNPVAVLINKALIEIPPRFRDRPPVFPGLADSEIRQWNAAEGLAADVRAYGRWMRVEAQNRIGHLYPNVTLPDQTTAAVIAWIWARSVTCPNPACGIEMPLVRSWWLGKKKGKEAYVIPTVVADSGRPGGRRVELSVEHGSARAPAKDRDGTSSGGNGRCVACDGVAPASYIRAEGKAGRLGAQLMAVVAEGNRRRIYVTPNHLQEMSAAVPRPAAPPTGMLPESALGFRVQGYGYTEWAQLFTNRQLVALSTLSDLVDAARDQVLADARRARMATGEQPVDAGAGAEAYADAVATYLAIGISRFADRHSRLTTWDNGPAKEYERSAFAGPKLQMASDFVESNPFGGAGADIASSFIWVERALASLPKGEPGVATQADAASRSYAGVVISTDPPYYSNVGYAALSDLFYVWLRKSLRPIYPSLFATMLVPKDEELVAEPSRHGGVSGAHRFFEAGFRDVFALARESASQDYPITVYYAFKQSESTSDGEASTGWETLLEGMIQSGWEITSTWPIRSEMANRLRSIGSNALATSIVLSLRPREPQAPITDRREYIDLLREELPGKLKELQQGTIAPVDLAQAAIGPGMAVFSRYSRVVEPNGRNVTVREALRLINAILAEVLSDQEGDFDTDTRWCVKWFETHGFDKAGYGEAETLAGAYNSSVKGLDRSGAVFAKGGEVRLLTTAELPKAYRPECDEHITLWEVAMHLVKALDESGLAEAGRILDGASTRVDVEAVKELAYLVFSLAEKRSMVQVAGMFNALVTSWPEVTAAAQAHASAAPRATEQAMLALDEELGD